MVIHTLPGQWSKGKCGKELLDPRAALEWLTRWWTGVEIQVACENSGVENDDSHTEKERGREREREKNHKS